MPKKHTNVFYAAAIRLLIYGLFAVFCHGVLVFLYVLHSSAEHSFLFLSERAGYMLEHTLMSLLIVIVGAFVLLLEGKNMGT